MDFLNLVLLVSLAIASTHAFSIGKTKDSNMKNEHGIPTSAEREVVEEETKDVEAVIADLSEQKISQAVGESVLDLSESKQENNSVINVVEEATLTGHKELVEEKQEGNKHHGHGGHEVWMKEQERHRSKHGHGKINKFDHHGHKYDKHDHDHFDSSMESDESSEEHCDKKRNH